MSNFILLPSGTALDNERYVLIEDPAAQGSRKHILGQGAMGAVYLAEDTRLGCEVAVKQTTVSSVGLAAFRHEASLLANLRHPALPRVQDYFNDANGYFIVMELIRGEDLEERLERSGKLPFEDIRQITIKLLEALEYLHSHKVVHKDIKPANLKLTSDGDLKVLDFGLAKGSAGLMTNHTSTILSGATPAYAPPEQLRAEKTSPQSDLYSAVATIYHLASGELPPNGLYERALSIAGGAADPLQLLSDLNEEVPREFAEILHEALALLPANRPSSASVMKEQLLKREREIETAHLKQQIEEAEKKAEERFKREHQERQLSDKEKATEFFNRGLQCHKNKDFQGAIDNYAVAIALNPNSAFTYHNRGSSYTDKGDYDQGIKDYGKAIDLNPNYASAYYGRGLAYKKKYNYDQAIKDCSKAIELKSNYREAYIVRGNAYYSKGDYSQAIKDYNEAIKIKPDYTIAYENRALAFDKKGETSKAQADRQKAKELNEKK
jgi:serine/threonine protein kinase